MEVDPRQRRKKQVKAGLPWARQVWETPGPDGRCAREGSQRERREAGVGGSKTGRQVLVGLVPPSGTWARTPSPSLLGVPPPARDAPATRPSTCTEAAGGLSSATCGGGQRNSFYMEQERRCMYMGGCWRGLRPWPPHRHSRPGTNKFDLGDHDVC